MDLSTMLRAKGVWDRFGASHPQFPAFLRDLRERRIVRDGTAVEIAVTPPGGETVRSNLRLTAQEAALFREVSQRIR